MNKRIKAIKKLLEPVAYCITVTHIFFKDSEVILSIVNYKRPYFIHNSKPGFFELSQVLNDLPVKTRMLIIHNLDLFIWSENERT